MTNLIVVDTFATTADTWTTRNIRKDGEPDQYVLDVDLYLPDGQQSKLTIWDKSSQQPIIKMVKNYFE